MAHRGKRVALIATVLGLAVMALTVWSFRTTILEHWYLRKIEMAVSEKEAAPYWDRLRRIAKPRTVPRLLDLLRVREGNSAEEFRKDLLETAVAIGPDGVAAVLREADEKTFEALRWPIYKETPGGREAILDCLANPDPLVRLRAIACTETISIEDQVSKDGFVFPLRTYDGDEGVPERILPLIDDGDRSVRAAAAARLAGPFPGNRAVRREIRASLRDGDAGIRRKAVGALRFGGGRMALPELIAALKDPDLDTEVRSGAVDALGASGAEEAVGALAEAISDPALSEGTLKAIAELRERPEIPRPCFDIVVTAVLRALDGDPANPAVLTAIDKPYFLPPDGDGKAMDRLITKNRLLSLPGARREEAVRFLLRMPPKEPPDASLLAGILGKKTSLDAFAAWALDREGVDAAPAVPGLIAAVERGFVDEHLIAVLGKLAPSDPRARITLVKMLEDPIDWCRRTAARALRESARDPEVHAALMKVVENPDTSPMLLAAAASSALAGAGPAPPDRPSKPIAILRTTLRERLRDAQPSKDEQAKWDEELIALATVLGPAGAEFLPHFEKSLPNYPRCARAILSIAPAEAPEVVKVLIDAVRRGETTWNECAPILEGIGPAALMAAPFLVDGLAYAADDFEPPILAIGPPAIPPLVAALARDDTVLVSRAAEVLGKMGPEAAEAVPALRKLLEDADEEVQREAEKALLRITAGADR
jgi:HEAT repeat protein